jgi:general secretion pathway protein I
LSRLGVPEDASAGFTLVEALAALAVMAAGLTAVAALTSASLHATLNAQRHLADLESARMIMAGLPDRSALPFGRLTGSLAARNWRIDTSPVSKAVTTGQSIWTLQGIALLVRSPSGATTEIDTIRLRRQTAP